MYVNGWKITNYWTFWLHGTTNKHHVAGGVPKASNNYSTFFPPPLPFCRESLYRSGRWMKSSSPIPFPVCMWNNHRNCHSLDKQTGRSRERIEKSYQWEWIPNNCRIHEFDGKRLVSTLESNKHRLIYVGDSLNVDMGNSMACMMNNSSPTVPHQLVKTIRDDFLGCPSKKDPASEYGTERYCSNLTEVQRRWQTHIDNHKITDRDILVVNTGAHWYGRPENAAIAFSAIANALSRVFRGTLIVRTTVMGHKECQLFEEPLEPNGTLPLSLKDLPFNWANFGKLNEMITKAVAASTLKDFKILYVDMFEQRPDGHALGPGNKTDCLHYCVPGPIDWWNKLLYHIIHEQLFDS